MNAHKYVEWYVYTNKWHTYKTERHDQPNNGTTITVAREKCVGTERIPNPPICARCSWIADHPNHH